ncbi:hypothetical protein ABH19_06495 [Leptospirillum sp. Group II 'CF-1']|nr:hypothetical protein ABH19_06495 [Leptospirillum sp. Group II 'CF-1']
MFYPLGALKDSRDRTGAFPSYLKINLDQVQFVSALKIRCSALTAFGIMDQKLFAKFKSKTLFKNWLREL